MSRDRGENLLRFDNFRQEVGPSRRAAQSRREQNGHQPF